jgi:hypothetical protein
MALSRALNHLVIGTSCLKHGRNMAVPMASPEPYRSPAQSSIEPFARLSDDLGLVRAEVERQLTRALERYQDAR